MGDSRCEGTVARNRNFEEPGTLVWEALKKRQDWNGNSEGLGNSEEEPEC